MSNIDQLLIVSVTPQNLERGALWYKENAAHIKTAGQNNLWWRNNSLSIEKDLVIKPGELSRKLIDLGYERGISTHGRGMYAIRGGLIEVWPINTEKPYVIEFVGNTIASIHERPESRENPLHRLIPASGIEKLKPGNFVVHVDHGIGIFRGIATKERFENFKLKIENSKNSEEFFVLEYAAPGPGRKPDTLYVPTTSTDRLSPYIGFETPTIHRLGGNVWFSTKRKAQENVEALAHRLLELYRIRHLARRESPAGDALLETKFHETFRFVETADQERTEQEILQDFSRPQPMDRILCGDVGFGKTELAFRAALRMITSGKQVILLAPTTILVSQHEETARARFSDIPVTIAALSRLTPRTDEQKIIEGLKTGTVDLCIGTHRMLSRDIECKNLGLAIIDEEQRFGVKQKERFKEMRSEIDILSLSATPIPRTLSLALTQLRSISVLESPPPGRLSIETYVLPYSTKTIREAVTQETARGGQLYFLHNRIETLGATKEKLEHIIASIPQKHPIRIGVIHGRMDERELIKTMEQFRNGTLTILLATTIIENGLDISNANTLIVDDATRLGLAQAHQLRGRIGRGINQAHAYFLYRPKLLTDIARERLEALQEYAKLGAGYHIALRDLEIRGAGNVLGKEQSGIANKVGLNLYCQMLTEALENLDMIL